ncbi:MAG: AbrB/MazE/SpoVT family DNA-binding domain-containing protein [Dehalococcoidaceae bacterium]|nr:AbrB/MazE/SpoVT family DNA-binding domain-containing protein [Dehalococcoidaceae bacterium]
MKARIQKWGNSLALRIPKYIAEDAGLHKDGNVELTLFEGKMLVAPEIVAVPTLENLIAGVTAENLHTETDSGIRSGNEAW